MKNCWEFKNCGRQPGGSNVNDLGLCPAATDTSSDGLNRGKNGGIEFAGLSQAHSAVERYKEHMLRK